MGETQELEEKCPPPLESVDIILQFSVLLNLYFLLSNNLYSPCKLKQNFLKKISIKRLNWHISKTWRHIYDNYFHLKILSSSDSASVRPYAQPVKDSISFSYLKWRAIYLPPRDLSRSTNLCFVTGMYAQNLIYQEAPCRHLKCNKSEGYVILGSYTSFSSMMFRNIGFKLTRFWT